MKDQDDSETRVCPKCGNEFYIPCRSIYVWKMPYYTGGKTETLYLCGYTCREAMKRAYAEEKQRRAKERAQKAREARRAKNEQGRDQGGR